MTASCPGPAQPSGSARRALLVTLCAVQFIDAYDVAAMGPALPRIQRELAMSPDALQWVVTAYVLGYGGFLLVGGRLADLVDRKRLLIGSLAVFAAVSAVGGAATAGWLLIAARLVKGITAAFTAPVSLAILLRIHQEENARNKALGAYLSMAAVGFTSGLVLGGVLATVTWRLVLLVPAGLALLAVISAARIVPSDQGLRRREREPVDLPGAVAVTSGLMALVYGVSRASASGWGDDITVSSLAASVALLVIFVCIQHSRRVPLVRLEIFTRPGLSQANVFIFLLQGGYVGWQFVATLFLQNADHWSPIAVGLVFVPNLVFGLASVIMGTGYAMSYSAANITVVAAARPGERGMASGIFIAAFQIGGGVILGVVASVFTTRYTHHPGLDAYRWAIATAAITSALATLVSITEMIRGTTAASSRSTALTWPPPSGTGPGRSGGRRP
jgi:MFS family permease